MIHLRFFLSSPGDVTDERTFAQQVIEQELPKDPLLRGQITCEVVRWDDPNAPVAMPATVTPQKALELGLPKPSECDAVIVILWSRMGTPLPESMRKPDGSPYLSGTEWEYEDGVSAQPAPTVLVYRRTTRVQIDPDDPALEEKLAQHRRVKEFFKRFQNPDGSLRGGVNAYDTPQEFRDRLRVNLRAFIEQRLAGSAAPRLTAPPPYAAIAKALSAGRVVPVIGADAPLGGGGAGADRQAAAPVYLPSGVTLARLLADASDFPSTQDRDRLPEVASYYEAFESRDALHQRLRELLGPQSEAVPVPDLYRLLAEVAVPLLIFSTNYDTQLECAFRATGKAYDLVVYPANRKDLANAVLWWPHGAAEPKTPAANELDIDLTTTTVIFKMHGSILAGTDTEAWDGFVITEEDYVEFLSRVSGSGRSSAIPALFTAHVHDRSLLFINYSLRDWAFRIILHSLSRYFPRQTAPDEPEIPSWAVDAQLPELDSRVWRKRGVYPYQVDIDEFVRNLRARMPK
ncbi:MAG TPA: SIR2 family protein [Candidatus Dormibacteraeota bacterium]|nr:SIR2 family protein [Candidatus Dormibacteraeota bacterium]